MLLQYRRDRPLRCAIVSVPDEQLVATHIRNSVFRNSRIVASCCSITGGSGTPCALNIVATGTPVITFNHYGGDVGSGTRLHTLTGAAHPGPSHLLE